MSKTRFPFGMLEMYRFIAERYRTDTSEAIYKDVKINHPEWDISEAQISTFVRKMKKVFDDRIAECRANGRYDDAARISLQKHEALPDKRSRGKTFANIIVDEEVVRAITDQLLNPKIQLPLDD